MEIKLIHILGPVLATVAMFFYGKVIVGKANGRQIRVGPTLLLILGAILFRQFTGDGTFLDRICLTLMDFGIALIIDSAYLAKHKEHPKMFWVPGILALVVSFAIYFTASLFGWTVNSIFGYEQPPFKKAEVLIELGPDDEITELNGLMQRFEGSYQPLFPGMSVEEDADLAKYYLVDVADDRVAEFIEAANLDKENVDAAEINAEWSLEKPLFLPSAAPADGQYLCSDPGIRQQWWLTPDVANPIHELLSGVKVKKKAKVAIIDTGVDAGHEDLKSVFGGTPGGDEHGHGTHCAGLAGAHTNNGLGMASFNWEGRFLEVRSYPALNRRGQGDNASIARAIQAAAKDGCDVISMSLGMVAEVAPKVIREAADYAFQRRCILVAAAGNDHGADGAMHSPANISGVIAVAAVAPDGKPAVFSNRVGNLRMGIAAPGQGIFSTLPGGTYEEMSGTSMATPIVAGFAGILRACFPTITKEMVWQLLYETGANTSDSREYGRTARFEHALQAAFRHR